ncbi:extensin family protein [Aquabacter sp. L1I39]|uniref:extensin-like domain-containing protein n=1 Tax=Aquabacter sp. L1I39 TaxID=2820278 RepID=UPI001ADB5BD7|nr:extensin family protein [Aquabacter sp. L1I39]QTL01688.1 extensin family protein [Aquabacter sp. L1I39]
MAEEPGPRPAEAPGGQARSPQPLTIGGKRVAYVPLPEPRPLELDETEEDAQSAPDAPGTQAAETSAQEVAPLLIPPPPPSGSQVGRPQKPSGVEAVAGEDLPEACASLVAQQAMLAVRVAAIESPGACGLPVAVKVSAIRLQDGKLVTLQPAAVLACETAVNFTNWMRDDMAPAIETMGAQLEAIKVAASYDCRPRNRIRGAQMSEHGRGNAIDVGGFVLSDQRVLDVKKNGLPLPLQTAMKTSACERFTTVLGPGSDGYHEDHIHVDIAKRRLDIRLCRWTIKGPTPPAEPVVARAGQSEGEAATGSGSSPASDARLADASPIPFPTPRPPLPGDRPNRARGG